METFWNQLPAPFFALAPMEDVTDTVFREVVMSVARPGQLHVVFSEFTSTDGLCSERGRDKVSHRLRVNPSEQDLLSKMGIKLVAQIWGHEPEYFRKSAALIEAMGVYDGIDINMGCPVKKVVKHASCSALINFPEQAKEIVLATKQATRLPVSVKTRIGFNTIDTENWIGHLLETSPAAITVHGRTRKMMSEGPALWEEIAKAVNLRDRAGASTVILGNGSVESYSDGLEKARNSGVEGVMVGTGIFRNPWFFDPGMEIPSVKERVELLQNHIRLYHDTWGKGKDYNILKRFFKIYLNGFPGAAHWRDALMRATTCDCAIEICREIVRQETSGLQPAPSLVLQS